MNKSKSFFSADRNNQLHVKVPSQTKPKILKGSFTTDKNNNLIYLIDDSDKWHRKYDIPDRLEFEGKWKLDENHNLALNIKEKEGLKQGYLVLRGDIIDQEGDSFVFSVKSKVSSRVTRFSYLKLKGLWKADKFNRLSFEVKKQEFPDELTLNGIWEVNKNQKISYSYEKTDLLTKRKKVHTFVLEGFWQISQHNRITYVLSRGLDSRFDFRAYLQTPNLYSKNDTIKYRIGIGVKEECRERIISFYGEWKFGSRSGISFTMDYGKGREKTINFGSYLNLSKHDKLIFSLVTKEGRPTGISLEYTHDFLKKKHAQAFIRLKKLIESKRIEAGVSMPF